jgi:hypothetical protein
MIPPNWGQACPACGYHVCECAKPGQEEERPEPKESGPCRCPLELHGGIAHWPHCTDRGQRRKQ